MIKLLERLMGFVGKNLEEDTKVIKIEEDEQDSRVANVYLSNGKMFRTITFSKDFCNAILNYNNY